MSEDTTPKRRGRPLGSKNKPKNPTTASIEFRYSEIQEVIGNLSSAIDSMPERADVRKFLAKNVPDEIVELVDREQNRNWYNRRNTLTNLLQGFAVAADAIEARVSA